MHWYCVCIVVLLLMGVCFLFCFAVFSYFQNFVLRLQEWPLVWNICIVIIPNSKALYPALISIGIGVIQNIASQTPTNMTHYYPRTKALNQVFFFLTLCHVFNSQTLAMKGYLHPGDYKMAKTTLPKMPLQGTGSKLWHSLWAGCIWLQKIVLQVFCCPWQSCCE